MTDEIIRSEIFPEPELPSSAEIISQGKVLAKTWGVGHSEFLNAHDCTSESEFKCRAMKASRVMQHAHMGFRDYQKSLGAFSEIYEKTISKGVNLDRYGICLDWSMGFPRNIRDKQMQGTGLILNEPDDFATLCNAAPVASHFGDFVLGFPAALENTQYSLSAGSTIIGNLGQYFTFRLPNWSDDLETTRSTLTAIALMASQPVDVLVHSNLDDGFAAVFSDLSCALGAAMIERYLIEGLMGGKVTHCFGHHYTTPLLRFGFQKALSMVNQNPGSMIFGNTVSYRGDESENYASLSGYLMVDIAAQNATPSGHAINPVPVTENKRIPDIDEIIDAQLFASRLVGVSRNYHAVVDPEEVDKLVKILIDGGTQFKNNLLSGFENAGIDIKDPFEMFLGIRRVGGKKLEQLFGPGSQASKNETRIALVLSDTIKEIDHEVEHNVLSLQGFGADKLCGNNLTVVVATTDVHEHGKMLLEGVFQKLNLSVVNGGVSVDPRELARTAESCSADAIALSTYCGIALTYYGQLKDELDEIGMSIPVMIGGQLNEIPENSESSLPLDVGPALAEQGAVVCRRIHDAMPCLIELARNKNLC